MLEKQNKYSIRKLTVGAASVLIGASFFAVNGKTVKADTVNDTNNVDSNKVVQERTGEKAPESTQDSLLKGTDKIEKNSSVESGMNANTNDAQVNQDNPAIKDSQQAGGVDASNVQAKQANTGIQPNTSSNRVDGTLQTSAPAKQGAPAIGITQKQDNTINNGVKVPETQTLNLKRVQNIKLNTVSLQDSKVQTQNATTNGGFDEATWGKLDVNSWKGQAENGVYQLTDYTGDLAHIIVPNAADFAAAGKDIGDLQVGINADTTHGWFEKGDPKTIAFSKTSGEKVKAVGKDWTAAFTGDTSRSGYGEGKSHSLTKFDGNNLDVSNVTNMRYMFEGNKVSDIAPLTNWNVDNVTDMNSIFYNNKISDVTPLANWNVDNVTDMNCMFGFNNISDVTPLANWKTDNVTDMHVMFSGNQIKYADFTKWNFNKAQYLGEFIYMQNNAIILIKDSDQTKLSGKSRNNDVDPTQYPVISTKSNQLTFTSITSTSTIDMPTLIVASTKDEARKQILANINSKLSDYKKNNPNMIVTPATSLDSITDLVDLANAKFNVAQIATVTVHFFDDIGTNQDNTPKDITLNNQVVGHVLTIDTIKDNPELANYNLVPGTSYTVAENTPWLVHLTHKTSEHDASLPATRTICVHRLDGTTQTTVQTIGYKYTVTHDLVTNQDFNSEPIFDKYTTETIVTTVDKNGKSTSQTDKSTVFYTKASDGKYYNFNSFKLPTFPGYKIHMTANSSGIEISYARRHLNTINLVDSTDPSNIVKTYNVSGFTGQTVATDISDNIPENWEILPSVIAPETITYTSNDQEDAPINIKIRHKVVDVSKDNDPTFEADSVRNVTREIYVQLDGESDYIDSQQISLRRHGTFDLVTKQITWGSYEPVQVPAYTLTDVPEDITVENPNAAPAFTANGDTKDMVATFRCHYNSATGSGGASYISAANFAIMPTDSTSLTLPKIADSVQVPQSKNVQKEDDVSQRTVKPHAAISKQELDSLVKTAALPSVKLNKQNLKELKQIFVNNNPKDLRSISWKLQDSVLSSSTPLYTLSNSSNSIMLPHLTGYKFKLIKRGTGENSVSFIYSKDKNYKYVFNIAFKDNVMYFTVLTPNKAHNKLTVKQVYNVHNQKELANILSLYL